MRILVCLLATLVTGCVTPTTTTRTETFVRTTSSEPGPVRGVRLETYLADTMLGIRAVQLRDCHHEESEVTRTTTRTTAEVHDIGNPGPLALVVLPIAVASMIVTGIAVAADSPETSESSRFLGRHREPCNLPGAGIAVELTFATGTTRVVRTDHQGVAAVELPTDGPPGGVIQLRARDAAPVEIAYPSARRRTAHADPVPSAAPSASVTALAGRARVAARAGDCRRVRRFAAAIRHADPSFHASRVITDPALAPCLDR